MLEQLASMKKCYVMPNALQLQLCTYGKVDDGLQDVLEAAPYYLLGQNTVPVDVLQLVPQSGNVTTNTAQGVFQSANHTKNTALITLMVRNMTHKQFQPASCLDVEWSQAGAKKGNKLKGRGLEGLGVENVKAGLSYHQGSKMHRRVAHDAWSAKLLLNRGQITTSTKD